MLDVSDEASMPAPGFGRLTSAPTKSSSETLWAVLFGRTPVTLGCCTAAAVSMISEESEVDCGVVGLTDRNRRRSSASITPEVHEFNDEAKDFDNTSNLDYVNRALSTHTSTDRHSTTPRINPMSSNSVR